MKRLRSVMWQGVATPSLEHLTLSRSGDQYELRGLVLRASEKVPYLLRYRISLDEHWVTTGAEVELANGTNRRLSLVRTGAAWLCNGREQPELGACVDVDVEWSPSTNTLPIRRLALAQGQSASVTAVWIRLPALTVQPLDQSYGRLDARTYDYRVGDFRARLLVDEDGLVVDYEGGWKLVATQGS